MKPWLDKLMHDWWQGFHYGFCIWGAVLLMWIMIQPGCYTLGYSPSAGIALIIIGSSAAFAILYTWWLRMRKPRRIFIITDEVMHDFVQTIEGVKKVI